MTNITLTIILFVVTLVLAYICLTLSRVTGNRILSRFTVIFILINLASQVYLLINGHVTCTLVFLGIEAVEAVLIGTMQERLWGLLRRLAERYAPQIPQEEAVGDEDEYDDY